MRGSGARRPSRAGAHRFDGRTRVLVLGLGWWEGGDAAHRRERREDAAFSPEGSFRTAPLLAGNAGGGRGAGGGGEDQRGGLDSIYPSGLEAGSLYRAQIA